MEVGVHEAKTTLSKLLKRVAAGEEITITRGGEPVARLVAAQGAPRRTLGQDRGRYGVPDDFDAPLDEAALRAFEA
ncbi:MAG TPA: type II toxin-antitoxin system prevent-host-death family antitoxin [Egibacteraceae bacterium]|nr:type II toxin-antitoxin system prevent-host-death family antitoxin [Egibacteraceae bacterium]